MKKERKELKNSTNQRKNLKLIKETKCVCTQCHTVWFYGKDDTSDNFSNRLISVGAAMQSKSLTSSYHKKLIKDFNKCSNCGSRAITKEEIKHLFNSRTGETIEYKKIKSYFLSITIIIMN